MKLKAGFAKHEITCLIPGLGMMGYGQPHNTVQAVATPLWARAMVMEDLEHHTFILVHLEQAFVTMAIKEEILKQLAAEFPSWKITDANLMITAQHTHSAPGGYGHYPFYNFTIPGFQLKVFHTICSGIMEAIKLAYKDISSVKMSWGQHIVAADKDIAFNRSMKAFLHNDDAPPIQQDEWHLGINRQMQGLIITTDDGKEKAFIHWFGVHCTSVSSFNHSIHHDNKGVAASLYEQKHPGSMAFFMQEAAGDVSPNFIWEKKIRQFRGKYKDHFESANFNGELQFREAEKIQGTKEITGRIQCFHQFMDMAQEVAPAAHGIAFFEGTTDGQGIPKILGNTLRVISRLVKTKDLIRDSLGNKAFYEAHHPKDILLDHRNGSFIGLPLRSWKKLPKIPEPSVEAFRSCAINGSLNTLPWAPAILPFQLVIIGPLAIVAVPGEITTTSAARLKEQISQDLSGHGVDHVIISSYSNAFMGYITTPEEYATQSYEAGHTIFGHGTLRGIMKGFKDLVDEFKFQKVSPHKRTEPFHFPADELAKRSI
jgi:neutral ceramidase